MDTFFIPNENDFKRWIKEALKELLEFFPGNTTMSDNSDSEPLLSRKEIAFMFKVSLVTLNNWKKAGLPSYKQGGRVYFLYSYVMPYLKQKKTSVQI
ncbi:helix-turn-helix domain-containing protein [Chitinophaga hostae]|uniref:helix-turn-helix domain-containing protein n=1 Tax=Chitinophaga hostae TaxID=2831022 RepID=UPI003F69E6A1